MYDCTTNGLRLSNIVGNNAPSAVTHEQNGIPRLFANCNCGTTNDQAIGNSFNPQIFAEDFPTDLTDTNDGWYLYSTKVYEFNNNTEPSLSYALRMNVTTVDNVAFGVTGGMQVEIIIFFPDLPPQEKEIWPGLKANYAFSTIYAQTAEEQSVDNSNKQHNSNDTKRKTTTINTVLSCLESLLKCLQSCKS